MLHRISHVRRLPSPALGVAVAALFLALTGGAVAAGIVPLAKHAQTADSATVARNAFGSNLIFFTFFAITDFSAFLYDD